MQYGKCWGKIQTNQNRDNSLRCVVFYLAQYPCIHMRSYPEALIENNQGQNRVSAKRMGQDDGAHAERMGKDAGAHAARMRKDAGAHYQYHFIQTCLRH